MSERYVVVQACGAASGVWYIYDEGVAPRTCILVFGRDYPGGPEAGARAEAARLNGLEAKKPVYVVKESMSIRGDWLIGAIGATCYAARFYPDAPGGAKAAAEEQARRWNEEAQ